MSWSSARDRHPTDDAADLHPEPTIEEIGAIVTGMATVAIVGASPDPERPSNEVMAYLLAAGFTVWPVTPLADEVLGVPSHASLAELPAVPDVVDVFRRVDALAAVAEQAIAIGAPVLWFQEGLRDDAAAGRAHRAGVVVVQDRCLRVEHERVVAPGGVDPS